VHGASQGVINGSFMTFGMLFLSALFIGRLWCGWACPAAGLGEICFAMNGRPARGGKLDWIKWLIWVPWVALIAIMAVSAGGYRQVNPLHLMESGVSVSEPAMYIAYYSVVGVFLGLSLAFGRRAGCHYICWMAPFMIMSRKIRGFFRWPALRLRADLSQCTDCKKCTRNCPMSLDVNGLVHRGNIEHAECILCGTCVDGCPARVIRYSFSAGR
jgi:ferredoxin-type protein NapH